MEWLKHNKVLALAIVLGGIVLVRVARGSSSTVSDSYQGPSIVGAPGPVVTMPTNTDQSGGTTPTPTPAPATDPMQLAAFIAGEVEKARTSANVANTASATTTNVDLMTEFLKKIKPGKLQGNKMDISYNETGQLTGFSINKILAPMTLSQQAAENAKATAIDQKSILAGYGRGFVDAKKTELTNAEKTKLSVSDYLAAIAAGKKTGGNIGILPHTRDNSQRLPA